MESQFDTIIAIDPGASGGIAIRRTDAAHPDGYTVKCHKMPTDDIALDRFITHLKEISTRPVAFLEKVNMWPGDMQTGGKAFGINKLLGSVEKLKFCLTTHGIIYIQVAPVSWQSGMGVLMRQRGGETDTTKKNRFKAKAMSLYPTIDVTLWNADALLILSFGKYKLEQDQPWIRKQLLPQQAASLFSHS